MQIEHLNKETTDGTVRNLDALYQLFPSCFTEASDALGKVHRAVDWGKLRSLLGEYVEDGEPEKYDFTWVGKRAAQREAAAPCRKTLRPCPEESVDWDTTQNLYIEGDNLEVLKLLQNSYMGKVKMIYIDPPYNTGNDFVYHDDFAQSAEEYDEHNLDDEGNRYRKNTDSNGRFHSDWCSMIYARLMVARSLLAEDGLICISINENEIENLRKICDEVFGEDNLASQIVWKNKYGAGGGTNSVANIHEYILIYTRTELKSITCSLSEDMAAAYKQKDEKYMTRGGYVTQPLASTSKGARANLMYTIHHNGAEINPPKGGRWIWSKEKFEAAYANNEIVINQTKEGYSVRFKQYLYDENGIKRKGTPLSMISDVFNQEGSKEFADLFEDKRIFDFPKPTRLIQKLLDFQINESSNDDSLIIDFFSGSSTTAQAIIQQNALDNGHRKFIMVQWPEETITDSIAYKAGYKNICEIGKERIRRAGKKIKADSPLTTQDLDIGFRVLKCDESNYKPVAFAPKDYTQESLDMFLDNIKEERTGLDLLFDCMMRWGLELSLPYETQKVDGCTIYNVDEGSLVACFDGVVTGPVIDAIADTHPLRVVFRDSSFTEAAQKMNNPQEREQWELAHFAEPKDCAAKLNLFELFKQKCGWTDQEVQNNVRVI